jgi:hypothetical protein
VVHRERGERELAAHARHLHQQAAALRAQMRHGRPGQLDRGGEVGRDHLVNLLIGQILGDAEHAVARVRDDDVDAAVIGEGLGDDGAQPCRVGYI